MLGQSVKKKVMLSPPHSLTPVSVYKVTGIARKYSHSFLLTNESTLEAPVSISKTSIFLLLCVLMSGNTLLGWFSLVLVLSVPISLLQQTLPTLPNWAYMAPSSPPKRVVIAVQGTLNWLGRKLLDNKEMAETDISLRVRPIVWFSDIIKINCILWYKTEGF